MSEENVEIVRRAYDHLNRGDVEGLERICDDDFVMDLSERVFNPATYRGHSGIQQFVTDVNEAWERYHWEVEDTLIAGDSVVALLHCEGRSRQGGPEVDWRVAWLWKFEAGRPVSLRFYRDRDQALEAAGLPE